MNTKKRRRGKATQQGTVVVLESLDISCVRALRERLLHALATGAPVTLAAAAAQDVDTAGLQLLCAFARSAADRGVSVTWAEPAPALSERARLLGLDAALGLSAATQPG